MNENQYVLAALVPLLLGFAGAMVKAGAISRTVFALVAVGTLGAGGFLFLTQ